MYEGYLEIGGVPIINAEATEAYVRNLAPNMSLRARFNSETVHVANEEPAYRTPTLDEAPWVNPLNRASQEFFGMYPVSIEGVDDSTLSAQVTEYLSAGGTPLSSREASRSVRVSGLLVAATKLGAQAGLSWLRSVVREDGCLTCNGDQMRYFLAEPDVCPIAFGDILGETRHSFGGISTGGITTTNGSTTAVGFGLQPFGTSAFGVGQITVIPGTTTITPVAPTLLSYRFQPDDGVDPAMPADLRWEGSWNQGTVIEWGRMDILDPSLQYPVGTVKTSRANYIPNPTVRANSSGWTATNAADGMWQATGGADGGSYLQVVPIAPTGTPSTYGQGNYGSGTYGGAPTGATLLTPTTPDVPKGYVSYSTALRSTSGLPIVITITGADGVVIGTQTVTATADWERYVLERQYLAVAGTAFVSVHSEGAFDIDQAAFDASEADPGYIDGGMVENDYITSWTGVPDASRSTSVWIGQAETTWSDSNFRPYIRVLAGGAASLDLVWTQREVLDVPSQLLPYERFFYDVACTQGPQVTSTNDFGNHGYYIAVDMTFSAGNPYAYGRQVDVDVNPVGSQPFTDPTPAPPLDDAWLVDPDATAPTAAIGAPSIPNSTVDLTISKWQRYYVTIPANLVADWASSVPTVTINSLGDDVKQVRVRFHPNPFGYDVMRVDPLAYCSEFVLSFLPGSASLTVDGVAKNVTASKAGRATVSANHLLFGSDGGPITWPELSCAVPYVMTLDVPSPADRDLFDIGLSIALKE